MRVTISVRLPDELAKTLAEVSAATEQSKSFVVQKALDAYLEAQVNMQVSHERLNDPSDATIPLDTMRSELGLLGHSSSL